MKKIIIIFSALLFVLFLLSCFIALDVYSEIDYFADKDKDKFSYNPDKIYILRKDVKIFKYITKGYKFIPYYWESNPQKSIFLGTLKAGTKLKASRVKNNSTYFLWLPLLQSVLNFLEVLDGSFEGSEISVDSISIISEDSQPFHDTYKDISPNYQLFEEIDDLENIKLKLYDVPTINNY